MNLIVHKPESKVEPLRLSPIILDWKYRKEWQVISEDFVVLTRGEKRINNSLYRVGGIGSKPDGKNYFMLLKYEEAYYTKDICKDRSPKHLEGKWCILDKNGIEKVVLEQYKSCHLIKNSCFYTMNGKLYNIETGECYGHSDGRIESTQFIFIKVDGTVHKICKQTGFTEQFD